MDHQVQSKDLKKKIYGSIIAFLCIVVAISVVVNPEFIDYYYMKATGDYLLKNGSFNVNPFSFIFTPTFYPLILSKKDYFFK